MTKNDAETEYQKLYSEFTDDLIQVRSTFIRLNLSKVSNESFHVIMNASLYYLYNTIAMLIQVMEKDQILPFISELKSNLDTHIIDKIRKDNNV